MRKNCQQASAIVFLLFFFGGALTCLTPAAKSQQTPLRRVDIGGHALQLRVLGRGRPLVVLESGLGDPMQPWEKVQPKVAEFTQVLAYDRAGLGQSEPGPKPRTALQIAKELHTALQRARLSPPYILVAHSAAGFYIRVFAKTYPDEVAGMVFVDTTPEGFFDRLAAIQSPRERRDFAQQIQQYLSRASEGRKAEWAALPEQTEEARAAWPLPDVPVVLITGMKNEPDKSPEAKQLWLRMQNDWLKRIPNAKHIVTQKSGHYVQLEEPELVVEAIKAVAKAATKSSFRQ
jgi:pimeloyl-ACP methyl ester carboxylesterase